MGKKAQKPQSVLTKTKSQRLNWRKPAVGARQQNRKTDVFKCENRKTEPKIGQIRETENPSALLIQILKIKSERDVASTNSNSFIAVVPKLVSVHLGRVLLASTVSGWLGFFVFL